MKNKRKFLKCEVCGNITAVIEDSGKKMICCDKEMTLLKCSTTDEGKEKHVPQTKKEDGMLVVEVGTVPHPMTEKHCISWIAVASGDYTQIVKLKHGGKPAALLAINSEGSTVYAYCNIHGLWSAEFENTAFNEAACSAEFTEGCIKE